MAKLYYCYGTMNSGKSFQLQVVAHNYEEQGKSVLILKPAQDNKDEYISSRTGFRRKPDILVADDTNIYHIVRKISPKGSNVIHCVLIDEAQFLKKHHVLQLAEIVDKLDIPVMTFGLKNDFRNELFEGSYHLLAQAESINEVKTICWYCDKKAFMVLRFENDVPVYDGEQIVIDNEENRSNNISYRPVCRKCYHDPKIGVNFHG